MPSDPLKLHKDRIHIVILHIEYSCSTKLCVLYPNQNAQYARHRTRIYLTPYIHKIRRELSTVHVMLELIIC